MSIQSITDNIRKEHTDLLDRYIKYEMKRLNLTVEDLKDYELTRDPSAVEYEKDESGMVVAVRQTVRFKFQKKK
jgi:oligoendopeptidase F